MSRPATAPVQEQASGRRYSEWVLLIGAVLRAALIVYSEWHDSVSAVKYTDVDYRVISDGALHMYNGNSPYDRHTYRYSPVFAAVMVPNHVVHAAWGKAVCAAADVAVGWLLLQLLQRSPGVPTGAYPRLLASYVLNPITVAVSTRGSPDALVCLPAVATVYFAKLHPAAAGVALGVAVHLKLYPVLYTLPVLLYVVRHAASTPRCGRAVRLAAGAIVGFGVPTGVAFALYGLDFVHHTYLYHVGRVDFRHSFSPWFYPVYLSLSSPSASAAVAVASQLPQAVVSLVIGGALHSDLGYCLGVQTLAFVAFNRVFTAQYFVWYLAFAPLVLALWLACASLLEFYAAPVFLPLWAASVAFFLAHAGLLWVCLQPPPAHSKLA